MDRGPRHTNGAFSSPETRKRTTKNFSLLVGIAKTTSESQRREQEKKDKEEQDLMALGAAQLQRKHENRHKGLSYKQMRQNNQARQPLSRSASYNNHHWQDLPWQDLHPQNTITWRKGPSSRIENDNNSSRKRPKNTASNIDNSAQINSKNKQRINCDGFVCVSIINQGRFTEEDDFLRHFKLELSRDFNPPSRCPTIINFYYCPDVHYDEAIVQFSTHAEAQKVAQSSYRNNRKRPFIIELFSDIQYSVLGVSTSTAYTDTTHRDQGFAKYADVLNSYLQCRRRNNNGADKTEHSSYSTLSVQRKNRYVIKLNGKEGESEQSEKKFDCGGGGAKGSKSFKFADTNGEENSNSCATESETTFSDINDNKLPFPSMSALMRDSTRSLLQNRCNQNEKSRSSTILLPVRESCKNENNERHTSSDNDRMRQDKKKMEDRLTNLQTKYDSAEKETTKWKKRFEFLSTEHEEQKKKIGDTVNNLHDANCLNQDQRSRVKFLSKQVKESRQDYDSIGIEHLKKEKKLSKQYSDLRTKHDSVVLQLEKQKQNNHDLQVALANHKSLQADKDALVEKNSKLSTYLAKQTRLVETHREILTRLENEKKGLEGNVEDLTIDNEVLVEKHSKLSTDLAKQTRLVESHQETLTRLENEKKDLEGNVEDLTMDNEVYANRSNDVALKLARSLVEVRAKEDAYETSRTKILQKHEKELKLARALGSATSTPTSDATTLRLKEKLESKTKEHVDLQQNFNTIAMQNFRQSNTIEEQRQQIRRLREQLSGATGGPTLPLKIED